MRPGAKVLRESTPRSARFGARMVKAGASRVMPRIQDRMRASSEPATVSVPAELHPPGWYADPAGRFDYRYWNGGQWSDHVSRNGLAETDAFERPPDSRTSASVSGE
jgi:hypothetical protein